MDGNDSRASALLDRSDGMRRAGRIREALEVTERCLQHSPARPRALLLRARLLFEQGRCVHALEALQALGAVPGREKSIESIRQGLKQLIQLRDARLDPAFTTESMARLLGEQGYLLEAMEIYRRLFLDSEGEKKFWEEMLLLRQRLEQEGSREVPKESLAQKLAAWDRWMQRRQRGN